MIKFLYQNRTFSRVRVFFYMVIPLMIMLLPANFMDSYSLCMLYHLFDFKCLMCGMSRAFVHLLHFDIATAMQWNSLSPYLFSIVAVFVIIDCCFVWKTRKILIKS